MVSQPANSAVSVDISEPSLTATDIIASGANPTNGQEAQADAESVASHDQNLSSSATAQIATIHVGLHPTLLNMSPLARAGGDSGLCQ